MNADNLISRFKIGEIVSFLKFNSFHRDISSSSFSTLIFVPSFAYLPKNFKFLSHSIICRHPWHLVSAKLI